MYNVLISKILDFLCCSLIILCPYFVKNIGYKKENRIKYIKQSWFIYERIKLFLITF